MFKNKLSCLERQRADLILAIEFILWGSAYLLIEIVLETAAPFLMVSCCLGASFFVLLILKRKLLIELTWSAIEYGTILSGMLCFDFGMLMYGIRECSVSEAGAFGNSLILYFALYHCISRKQFINKVVLMGGYFRRLESLLYGPYILTGVAGGDYSLLVERFVFFCPYGVRESNESKSEWYTTSNCPAWPSIVLGSVDEYLI